MQSRPGELPGRAWIVPLDSLVDEAIQRRVDRSPRRRRHRRAGRAAGRGDDERTGGGRRCRGATCQPAMTGPDGQLGHASTVAAESVFRRSATSPSSVVMARAKLEVHDANVSEPVEGAVPPRWSPGLVVGLWLLVALIAVAFVLNWLGGSDGLDLVTASTGAWAYATTFLLVAADAVCPVFPGETTLNAASTLAAQGHLTLAWVVVAGLLGAIVGDSALYWLARRSSHRLAPRLEQAKRNEKVAAALSILGSSAPLLLVLGRFVPGMRFVVNATMGLTHFPYRRFLLWSSVGGVVWSVYTCTLAYFVATALSGFPLASVVISGAITTGVLLALYFVIRRRRAGRI